METCHWTAGAGEPEAAAVKVAVAPAATLWAAGWVVIWGAVAVAVTVRVAAVVVAVPAPLVKTARYWFWFWALVTAPRLSVVAVAPSMSAKLAPPLVETCHWTAGAGAPEAAAVKVAVAPAATLWAAGWVVIWGAVATVTVTVAASLAPLARWVARTLTVPPAGTAAGAV